MSGRGLDWYKHDSRAFIDGVQGMGPGAIGAYIIVLDLIYARGGQTRNDPRHLGGILGCSTRKAQSLIEELVEAGKLELAGEVLTNPRASRECIARRTGSETKANNARGPRQAEPAAARDGAENAGQASEINGLDETKPADIEKTETREDKNPHNPPEGEGRADLFSEGQGAASGGRAPWPRNAFETWYRHYPHKVGKRAARRAFDRIARSKDAPPFAELVDGLERYIAAKPTDRPWCNPATWLNQGRWADQPDPGRPGFTGVRFKGDMTGARSGAGPPKFVGGVRVS